MTFIWNALLVFLVRSRISEILWRQLVALVHEAESVQPENKRDWVLAQLTVDNASKWLVNLALEVAVGVLAKK